MLLSFQKTKDLLKKYQIPMVEGLVIKSVEQGIEFAGGVGYPVVLKLLLPGDLHKIDKGLVRLGIQSEAGLRTAFGELWEGQTLPDSGEILIQKQVTGIELFLGMKQDKSFGPVISFGLGGIFVEVLNDIVLGICPIDKKQALKIIESIKGYKILQGFRGQKSVDVEKLADILVNVSKMSLENENIQEIDFNPLFANGNNIMVADAKII